jgi:hypothetical protein
MVTIQMIWMIFLKRDGWQFGLVPRWLPATSTCTTACRPGRGQALAGMAAPAVLARGLGVTMADYPASEGFVERDGGMRSSGPEAERRFGMRHFRSVRVRIKAPINPQISRLCTHDRRRMENLPSRIARSFAGQSPIRAVGSHRKHTSAR